MIKYLQYVVFINLLSFSATISSAHACGETYVYYEFTSYRLFGVAEGFLIPFKRHTSDVYDTPTPATLDGLIYHGVTVTVSPTDQPELIFNGTLSIPEHGAPPGFFLWTPDEGSLALGSYQVMLNSGEATSLTVMPAETLESSEASLNILKLEEVERDSPISCCNRIDSQSCRDEANSECVSPDEYCKICWVSERAFTHRLSAQLNWSASAELQSMSHVRLVSSLGEKSVLNHLTPTIYKTLAAGESLPDQACLHLEITHMITGERLEVPEICIPSSSFMSAPRIPLGRDDYEAYELNQWLECEELTDLQRQILISAGLIEREPPVAGAEQAGAEQASLTNKPLSNSESCAQTSPPLRFITWLAFLGFLRRRHFERENTSQR